MGHGSLGHQPDHCGNDLGFSMVVTALSLGATAILTVILLTTMFKSGTSSNASVSNAPGVAEATSLQAQPDALIRTEYGRGRCCQCGRVRFADSFNVVSVRSFGIVRSRPVL